MAPNGADTQYGALEFDGQGQEAKSSPVYRLQLGAAAMALCVVGTFAMTAGYSTKQHLNTVTDPQDPKYSDEPAWPLPGSASSVGPDCACATPCSTETEEIPHRGYEAHFCSIIPDESEGALPCIGIDGGTYKTYPGYDPTVPCADDAGNPTGNCRAVCEFVKGRYDCWSFPCFNGGFCVDDTNGYTCNCDMGYAGEQCESDINECSYYQDEDGDNDGALDTVAVCDPNAFCQNSHGAYSCVCNSGFEGDGYREDGRVNNLWGAAYPPWITRPDAKEDPGYIQACQDMDSCRESQCQHDSMCMNMEGLVGQDDYDCDCPEGPTGNKAWVGHDCETDIDECDETDGVKHDCDPHATCVNTEGSFTCSCNEHWESTDLNGVDRLGRMWASKGSSIRSNAGCYDWPDCADNPCQHGGTCMEGTEGCEDMDVDGNIVMVDCYTCQCAYGWSGNDCEVDEDECSDSQSGFYVTFPESCHTEAFCHNVPGSFECSCNAGWTGDGVTCIDADDCEFSPCSHGGTCYDCGVLCFTCDCVLGWRGTTCGQDWNECLMGIHQCNDEASCANNPGSYDCRCDPGFTGNGFGQGFTEETYRYTVGNVQVTDVTFKGCKDIDDCDPGLYNGPLLSPNGPCVRGTCQDVGASAYICTCEPGFTDSECDMNINECDPVLGDNDCHRFAECTDMIGSYQCTCNEGYSGNGYSSCLDISDCYGQCSNGFCTDLGVDHFKCNCDNGWMNRRCDYDINECTTYTHQCARHATCSNTEGSYTCACNKGWAGDGLAQGGSGCENVDDCASNPCDWGECTDEGAGSYTCTCQDGYTDFNCDFDVNECYMKTHNCHIDARCVNAPGAFYCRCLSGWEGDGLTCTDLDDCDPDPCDPVHGTCEDAGPNKYHCSCMGGWAGMHCDSDENECLVGSHSCDPSASCSNTEGSHECACNNEYYGNGLQCTPCSVCGPGWQEFGVCEAHDRSCVNIDECVEGVDNCHDHATCTDNEGSFKCECDQNGPGEEFWGLGVDTNVGCQACTVCYDGYHEVEPCTSSTDRTCNINVDTGLYMVETEADDTRECLALMRGEWYPSRINFGNGDRYCGMAGATDDEAKSQLLLDGQAVWKFTHIGNENDQQEGGGGDLYTIEFNNGGYYCLFFGDGGKDLYPSLQNCHSYPLSEKDSCPWANGGKDDQFCGFSEDGMSMRDALIQNGQAIWRLTPLKLNANKYILQTASKGHLVENSSTKIWECLAFEEQGAATNPSRYNWGNGDSWCGAGDWEGLGKAYGLMNNKQAVFILTFLQAVE